jgi:hypothetical protein
MKVKFKNWKCNIKTGFYKNGFKAITLIDAKDGDAIAVATVNLETPEAKVTSKDHVYIKDYSENTGMVVALKEAGVIEYDITNQYYAQFVVINEYKLTSKCIALWKKDKN